MFAKLLLAIELLFLVLWIKIQVCFFSHTECALLCLLPQIAETGHTELRNCGQRGSYSPVLDFLHK